MGLVPLAKIRKGPGFGAASPARSTHLPCHFHGQTGGVSGGVLLPGPHVARGSAPTYPHTAGLFPCCLGNKEMLTAPGRGAEDSCPITGVYVFLLRGKGKYGSVSTPFHSHNCATKVYELFSYSMFLGEHYPKKLDKMNIPSIS